MRQVHARAHLPSLEDKNGVHVEVIDTYGTRHRFRYCSWINNSSRMYLLEGVAPALVCPPHIGTEANRTLVLSAPFIRRPIGKWQIPPLLRRVWHAGRCMISHQYPGA